MSERKPQDQLPVTSRSLPIALARAREKVMAPIRQMLADSGITEQQWRVLRVLSEEGSMDASRLADRACLLLPSLTRILQSMSRNGLVTREADKTDRRRQVVQITPAGKQIITDNQDRAVEIAQGFVDVLGQKRFDQLIDSLERLEALSPPRDGRG